jgi:hypothetical protein
MTWTVQAVPFAAWGEREGIDGHWRVSQDDAIAYVLHVAAGKGRWSAPAAYICSVCRDDAPSQYETGTVFCPHVDAVHAFQCQSEPAA